MIRFERTYVQKKPSVRFGPILLTLVVLASISLPVMAHGPHPVEVAAHFLSLSEEQATALVGIIEALHESTEPIAQQVRESKDALQELIRSAYALRGPCT